MSLHETPRLPVEDREWRMEDGLGGYCSGTVSGIRGRREQALLAVAREGGGAWVLVNGFDAFVTTRAGRYPITSQRYAPDATHPDGAWRIESFTPSPWPTWTFRLEDGTRIAQEIALVRGHSLAGLRWSLLTPTSGVSMEIRPFLSGREEDAIHRENRAFRDTAEVRGWRRTWRPYEGVPEIAFYSSARYEQGVHWYHNFLYADGSTEDLVSPGVFRADLGPASPLEIILAGGGWNAVVEGMIDPGHPVFWVGSVVPAVAAAPVVEERKGSERVRVAPKKSRGVAPARKRGGKKVVTRKSKAAPGRKAAQKKKKKSAPARRKPPRRR